MNENCKGFFITGTDTDTGKTYVSRLLIDILSDRVTTAYFKPVQTGCSLDSLGRLVSPDFEYAIKGNAVQTSEYEDHVPYRFKRACSPHLAADMEETPISFDHILDCFKRACRTAACNIVEGAGGLYVPLGRGKYIIDLMVRLDLPVILVTCPRLGTLNHTLLSIKAIESRGLTLAGIVFNNRAGLSKDYIYINNRKTITETVSPVPVVEVDHNQTVDTALTEFCDGLRKKFL